MDFHFLSPFFTVGCAKARQTVAKKIPFTLFLPVARTRAIDTT
jgi:hypothetical protein